MDSVAKGSVRVIYEGAIRDIDFTRGMTGFDLAAIVGERPDAVLLIKSGASIPIDDLLEDQCEYKIIKVASGG